MKFFPTSAIEQASKLRQSQTLRFLEILSITVAALFFLKHIFFLSHLTAVTTSPLRSISWLILFTGMMVLGVVSITLHIALGLLGKMKPPGMSALRFYQTWSNKTLCMLSSAALGYAVLFFLSFAGSILLSAIPTPRMNGALQSLFGAAITLRTSLVFDALARVSEKRASPPPTPK